MSSSDQEREQELAELLREVRALRQTIADLNVSPGLQPRLPPDYQVLVRSQPALPPDYAAAVRTQPALPPDYAVLVRANPLQPPSYEVLVRPVAPEIEEPPVRDE